MQVQFALCKFLRHAGKVMVLIVVGLVGVITYSVLANAFLPWLRSGSVGRQLLCALGVVAYTVLVSWRVTTAILPNNCTAMPWPLCFGSLPGRAFAAPESGTHRVFLLCNSWHVQPSPTCSPCSPPSLRAVAAGCVPQPKPCQRTPTLNWTVVSAGAYDHLVLPGHIPDLPRLCPNWLGSLPG